MDTSGRKKASDFPQELLNLFDKYVHGEIDRRAFLDGAQKFAVGGVTATMIWESLRPNYAWAQQVPKNDPRIKTEVVTVPSPEGNGSIKGLLVRPASATGKLPAVLVVHENRGLNPYIEDVARRLGTANFMAFAPDGLTSLGGYPGNEEEGAANFGKVDRNKMAADFVAAAKWLKNRPDCTGKLGAVAAQVTGSAVEVASLGEAFGAAVHLFGESNDKLAAQLQRIEAALEKSLTRSDEQLAYYVAQAREVIDLSMLSQKQILEDLQRVGGHSGDQRALAGTEAA